MAMSGSRSRIKTDRTAREKKKKTSKQESTNEQAVEIRLPDSLALCWCGDLVLFYKPLIGESACGLYILLETLARRQGKASLQQIQMAACFSSSVLEASRCKLEQYGLLQSYEDEDGVLDLFVLVAPKSREAFFEDPLLPRLLLEQAGSETYACIQALCAPVHVSKKRTNVSSRFDTQPIEDNWTEKQEREFARLQKQSSGPYVTENKGVAFDWQVFYDKMHNAIPNRLRTRENQDRIVELASAYGVNEETIRTFVLRHCRNRKTWIDFEAVREDLARTVKINTVDATDFTASPISFLAANQNGNAVVLPREKAVLVDLSEKRNLPNEVINTIVRYTLDEKNGAFLGGYVQTIGNNMARAGIQTRQQALDYLESMTAGAGKRKKPKKSERPERYNIIPEETVTEEDIAAMDELLAQVLGGTDSNGTS